MQVRLELAAIQVPPGPVSVKIDAA
jgi:hypothetical protein